jgi:N-methylhydantoinase A/oxoprolinase/acetone carboxylase beta subunit
VLSALTRQSAEVILETAFAEDGFDGESTVEHALVQRAVDGKGGIARLSVAVDRPVIGLGASAGLHYAGLPPLVGNDVVVPEDAGVANALGAVVGQVRVTVTATVSQPKEGLFRAAAGDQVTDFTDETKALDHAERVVRKAALDAAIAAGTDTAEIEVTRDIRAATVESQRTFVEAVIAATASGRPRIAR